MSKKHFDLIIIGGRCAGASLALNLAGKGLTILLLDRAKFPSLPNVPSAPFIHAATMRLLDKLGIPEEEYSNPHSKIERFIVHFIDYFEAVMPTSQMGLDRNYFQGIDRSRFDATLWKHASRIEGLTAYEGFSVTQILKDEAGVVTGVTGKTATGILESFTADLIVGADGRFSFSARHFGAKVIEEQNDFTSAVYHAEWENVEDYSADCPNAISTYNNGKGFLILVIPIDKAGYHIGIYMKSTSANFGAKGFEQVYHESLQAVPHLMARLKNARCVSEVVGMRPIENGYREAFGANWALLGDAVHYKDPSDGQGIYDALLESKLLADAIIDWKQKSETWLAVGASYQEKLMAATLPIFKQTVAHVKQTLYMEAPSFLINSLVRWLMTDPDFQRGFLRYLARADEKEPSISGKMLLNGMMADIRKRFKKA